MNLTSDFVRSCEVPEVRNAFVRKITEMCQKVDSWSFPAGLVFKQIFLVPTKHLLEAVLENTYGY